MTVQINISGLEPIAAALSSLAQAISGQNIVTTFTDKTSSAPTPVSQPTPEEKAEPSREDVQEETAYTLEEIRAKLAELNKAGKRAEVKELLASFGAAKLSEVPAGRYAALMVKAGEL